MAHRSKKKHLKHLHEQEPATPPAKSPVAKAEAARAGIANRAVKKRGVTAAKKRGTTTKRGTAAQRGAEIQRAREARRDADMRKRAEAVVRTAVPEQRAPKRGIIRRLAGKATATLSDKLPITPRKVLSRAKARMKARVSRVKSLLGTEA